LRESSWVRTGPASRVEIELDEGSAWRLGSNSRMELSDYRRLATGQRITLLSLDEGIAYFTGMSEGNDALLLAVSGAQVTVGRGTRVRLEVQEQWSQIAVIEGMVRFASPAAEMDLREGQTTRVEPANPARFFLSREVASMDLDRWSEERDKALSSSTSATHVVERYGLIDLDAAGEWIQTADLGTVWKPKSTDGWAPFQDGRWRWYEGLGYTWIGDEPWGWLPYHHGRWTRLESLGWVWAPAKIAVFKPGDVYWLRGAKLAGWGPLSPNEDWPAPANMHPQQFLAANTVWAAFEQDAAVIDPRGFTARPKEPLAAAGFVVALDSPALAASRLEAVRPLRRPSRGRVTPFMEGVTFNGSPAPAPNVPPPPVTVATYPNPAPPPPPPPDVIYAPPVILPIPNILIVNPRSYPDYSRRSRIPNSTANSSTRPQQPSASSATPTSPPVSNVPAPSGRSTASTPKPIPIPEISIPPRHERPPVDSSRSPASESVPAKPVPRGDGENKGERPRTPPREKKFRDSGESHMLNEVVKNITGLHYAQAITYLDTWSRRYRNSDFSDDRAYYYMQAYTGLDQPAKVVEVSTPLMSKDLSVSFQDPLQVIGVLYLASLNLQKLTNPTREQTMVGASAAYGLLQYLPVCFTSQNKPATVSAADWNNARVSLEALARQTITYAERPSRHN
jgi:hypothetical protein